MTEGEKEMEFFQLLAYSLNDLNSHDWNGSEPGAGNSGSPRCVASIGDLRPSSSAILGVSVEMDHEQRARHCAHLGLQKTLMELSF